MSNGGGGDGGCGFHAVKSAAEAIDPNDVTARLNAAPTQTAANFLKVMTLPLFAPLLPDPPCPTSYVEKQSQNSAQRADTPEPDTDDVGVGSTQSSPDCALISGKPCANRRKPGAVVAKVSHQRERAGDSISLKSAANLGGASRAMDTTAGISQD